MAIPNCKGDWEKYLCLLRRKWKFLLIQNSNQSLAHRTCADSRDFPCCVWKIKDLFFLVFILATQPKFLVPMFLVLQVNFYTAQ